MFRKVVSNAPSLLLFESSNLEIVFHSDKILNYFKSSLIRDSRLEWKDQSVWRKTDPGNSCWRVKHDMGF